MTTSGRNRVAILHGVNLNMLGSRDPEHYGTLTLPELEVQIKRHARELDLEASFFQSNSEGEFIGFIHSLPDRADAVVLNPGAWTHYSWAIHDALELAPMPAVEVHLSRIEEREEWRRHSVLDGLVLERISGKGPDGYRDALERIRAELDV